MSTESLVGRHIQRLPHGRVCVITADEPSRVRVKDTFWHGWVSKARLKYNWRFVDASQPVNVFSADREREGSCNGCQRRDDPVVYVVQLSWTSIRLCQECAWATVKNLTTVLRQLP